MGCTLPEDVWQEICNNFSSDTLTSCALVNSTFGDIAQRCLYRVLRLHTQRRPFKHLILHRPSGLQHTRRLELRGYDLQNIEVLFYLLAQFNQLRHLSFLVLHDGPLTPEFVASFSDFIALPSLHSLRMILLIGSSELHDALLTALFSCPVLTALKLSTTCPIYDPSSFKLSSSPARLQSLSIYAATSPRVNDTHGWPNTLPFVCLTELKSLEIMYSIDINSRPANFQAIASCLNDIPTTIENLSLKFCVDGGAGNRVVPPHFLPPVAAFQDFQCLRTLSIRLVVNDIHWSLMTSDFVPYIISNVSPGAPIHTIRIRIHQPTTLRSSFSDGVLPQVSLDPCWKLIRERIPTASLLMYLPKRARSQPIPPFPEFDRVILENGFITETDFESCPPLI